MFMLWPGSRRGASSPQVAAHRSCGSARIECRNYVAFSISARCAGGLKSDLDVFKCHTYIVFCIPALAPRSVLDASLLTKTSHERRSYMVFASQGLPEQPLYCKNTRKKKKRRVDQLYAFLLGIFSGKFA